MSSLAEPVRLTVEGPFSAATVLWRRQAEELLCTVVVKATYALDDHVCPLIGDPDPIQTADDHWDDDPERSIRVPSDLAPFKTTYDVLVVGHAHAERAVDHTLVRVAVGSIDKTIEVWTPRYMARDGTLETSAPAVRIPLRYEVAPGGADTENPVGIDPTSFDPSALRYRLPQVLLPKQPLEVGGFIRPVGLGPLSPGWRYRSSFMRPQDRAWLRDPSSSAMPTGFDASCLGAAPADQQSDAPFRADERLLLEGLRPKSPRLVTNLAGVTPVLSSGGSMPMPPLTADTLFVDTDRGIVTLTFRATLPVRDASRPLDVRVRDAGMRPEKAAASPVGEATLELRPTLAGSAPQQPRPDKAALEMTAVKLEGDAESSLNLPFSSGSPRARLASAVDDGALPFRSRDVPPPPASRPSPTSPPSSPSPPSPPSPPLVVAPPPAPPLVVAPPPAPPLVVTSPPPPPPSSIGSGFPALASGPDSSPPSRRDPPVMRSVKPSAPPPPPPLPAPPSRGRTIGEQRSAAPIPAVMDVERSRPSAAQSSGDGLQSALGVPSSQLPSSKPMASTIATFAPAPVASNPPPPSLVVAGAQPSVPAIAPLVSSAPVSSARAASDAAVGPLPVAGRPKVAERIDTAPRLRRRALVDLLNAEDGLARRLRRSKSFGPMLADVTPTRKRADEADADRDKERDERSQVLRVLSCAEPMDASSLHSALDVFIEEAADFEMPLFLVSGVLRPTFDELEALRTAVRIATPLGASDKRTQAVVGVARDALAAPAPPASDTARAMFRQIEVATQSLAVPARYLADTVERSLLETRSYKKLTILGEPRIRADFAFGSGTAWPMYVPETASAQLALLPSFAIVALVELRPREDALEAHSEALVVRALGRVVRVARPA